MCGEITLQCLFIRTREKFKFLKLQRVQANEPHYENLGVTGKGQEEKQRSLRIKLAYAMYVNNRNIFC